MGLKGPRHDPGCWGIPWVGYTCHGYGYIPARVRVWVHGGVPGPNPYPRLAGMGLSCDSLPGRARSRGQCVHRPPPRHAPALRAISCKGATAAAAGRKARARCVPREAHAAALLTCSCGRAMGTRSMRARIQRVRRSSPDAESSQIRLGARWCCPAPHEDAVVSVAT